MYLKNDCKEHNSNLLYTLTTRLIPTIQSAVGSKVGRDVTKGGKRGTRPERRVTTGAPNHCGGVEKSQQYHKYILQYSTFASKRPQVQTWGRQTCFLPRAP